MIPSHQLISLSNVNGVGPRRIRSILRNYPQLENITQLTKSDICQVEGISQDTARKIINIDLDFGKIAIEESHKVGAKYITYWDDEYPELLKVVWDSPIGIFTLGEISTNNMIGVVGTRLPSSYGKKIVETITRELVKSGFTIVSGLARGIDTNAHKTAVKYGGNTIAVLGNGIDICYPSENIELRNTCKKVSLKTFLVW